MLAVVLGDDALEDGELARGPAGPDRELRRSRSRRGPGGLRPAGAACGSGREQRNRRDEDDCRRHAFHGTLLGVGGRKSSPARARPPRAAAIPLGYLTSATLRPHQSGVKWHFAAS